MANIQERVAQDGSKSYRVQVRKRGYPPQTMTFKRKTDAKNWAQSIEASIEEGRYKNTTEAKKHTFGELVDRYIDVVLPRKPASAKDQERQLNWWKDELGDYRLSELSPALIQQGREKLGKRENRYGKPIGTATINRYMAVLSHMLNVGIEEFGWLMDSPMRNLKNLPEPKGRVRTLSDEERKKLLERCLRSKNKYLYLIVVLALSTGMRRSEILKLKWEQVDLPTRRIILYETKNNETRPVALAGLAYDLLVKHQAKKSNSSEYLFPSDKTDETKDFTKAWGLALKDAGIADFKFHDLRHSAASYLAMNGASLAEIADVLGHKSYDMVKRYAHLTDQHTAGVVESMNEKIFGNDVS